MKEEVIKNLWWISKLHNNTGGFISIYPHFNSRNLPFLIYTYIWVYYSLNHSVVLLYIWLITGCNFWWLIEKNPFENLILISQSVFKLFKLSKFIRAGDLFFLSTEMEIFWFQMNMQSYPFDPFPFVSICGTMRLC